MRSFFHFLRTLTKSSITQIRAQAFFPLPRPLRKPFFEKSFFITQIRVQALPIPTETNWRFMISARITQIRVQAFSDRVRAEYSWFWTERRGRFFKCDKIDAIEEKWAHRLCRNSPERKRRRTQSCVFVFSNMFLIFFIPFSYFSLKFIFQKKSRNSRRT